MVDMHLLSGWPVAPDMAAAYAIAFAGNWNACGDWLKGDVLLLLISLSILSLWVLLPVLFVNAAADWFAELVLLLLLLEFEFRLLLLLFDLGSGYVNWFQIERDWFETSGWIAEGVVGACCCCWFVWHKLLLLRLPLLLLLLLLLLLNWCAAAAAAAAVAKGELWTGLLRLSDELNLGNGLANCMFGVWRVLLIVLLRWCWAANEVLIGGGLGLYLWARVGERSTLLLLLFELLLLLESLTILLLLSIWWLILLLFLSNLLFVLSVFEEVVEFAFEEDVNKEDVEDEEVDVGVVAEEVVFDDLLLLLLLLLPIMLEMIFPFTTCS